MKTQKLDVVQVWKQVEDVLTPRLRLTPIERAVYLHLLRHSYLEGKRRFQRTLFQELVEHPARLVCPRSVPRTILLHALEPQHGAAVEWVVARRQTEPGRV